MKTSELIGAALDWAVAKIENPQWWDEGYMDGDPMAALEMDDENTYSPSTDWAQGGPIIERERIAVEFLQWDDIDCAMPIWTSYKFGTDCGGQGPTPLIAAMRCYVASKLGDEVEIPEALTQPEQYTTYGMQVREAIRQALATQGGTE